MKKLFPLYLLSAGIFLSAPAIAATNLLLKPENLGANLKGYSVTVIGTCHGESSAVRIKSFKDNFTPYQLTAQDINRLNCDLKNNKTHSLALHITGPDAVPSDTNKHVIIPYSSVKCGTIPFSLTDNTSWQVTFGIHTNGLYCKIDKVTPAAAVQPQINQMK